jgi:hypothetical protein
MAGPSFCTAFKVSREADRNLKHVRPDGSSEHTSNESNIEETGLLPDT